MINQGASGIEAALPFSLVSNTTGAPITGKIWTDAGGGATSELMVRLPGTAIFTNAVISRIAELSGGDYEYRLTGTETGTAGKVYYYCNVSGADMQRRWEDILAPQPGTTSSLTTVLDQLGAIAGLLHQNARLDNIVYNVNGLMTSARLRVFASAAACNAAVDGHADGADSEVYRFTIVGTDNGSGKLAGYKLTRVL